MNRFFGGNGKPFTNINDFPLISENSNICKFILTMEDKEGNSYYITYAACDDMGPLLLSMKDKKRDIDPELYLLLEGNYIDGEEHMKKKILEYGAALRDYLHSLVE